MNQNTILILSILVSGQYLRNFVLFYKQNYVLEIFQYVLFFLYPYLKKKNEKNIKSNIDLSVSARKSST